jgi:hypothetical protein
MSGWQCVDWCSCGQHPKWEEARGATLGRRVYFEVPRFSETPAAPGAWVVSPCPSGVRETGREPTPELVPPGSVVIRLPGVTRKPD